MATPEMPNASTLLALLIRIAVYQIIGTLALLMVSAVIQWAEGQTTNVSPALTNVKFAGLFFSGFLLLSGYVVSVAVLSFWPRDATWQKKAALSSSLFCVHYALFAILLGFSGGLLSTWILFLAAFPFIWMAERVAAVRAPGWLRSRILPGVK